MDQITNPHDKFFKDKTLSYQGGESMEPSGVEKIPGSSPGQALRVQPVCLPKPADLARKVAELERLAAQGEAEAVIEQLCAIVPTFHPVGINGGKVGART